jgi:hypothetical protein
MLSVHCWLKVGIIPYNACKSFKASAITPKLHFKQQTLKPTCVLPHCLQLNPPARPAPPCGAAATAAAAAGRLQTPDSLLLLLLLLLRRCCLRVLCVRCCLWYHLLGSSGWGSLSWLQFSEHKPADTSERQERARVTACQDTNTGLTKK